jgi:hypothetical protein
MKLQFLTLCLLLSCNFLHGSSSELDHFIKHRAERDMEELKNGYQRHYGTRAGEKEFLDGLSSQLESAGDRGTKIATIRSVTSSLATYKWSSDIPCDDVHLYNKMLRQIALRKYCCCVCDPSTKLSDDNIRDNVNFLKKAIQTKQQQIYSANRTELLELYAQGIDIAKLDSGEAELRKIVGIH